MAFSYHCKCEGYAANCSYLGHVPNAFGAEHLCRTSTLVERVGCTERGRGAGSQGQTCGGRKAFVMSHKALATKNPRSYSKLPTEHSRRAAGSVLERRYLQAETLVSTRSAQS